MGSNNLHIRRAADVVHKLFDEIDERLKELE